MAIALSYCKANYVFDENQKNEQPFFAVVFEIIYSREQLMFVITHSP